MSQIDGKRVLITGGTGSLGTALVKRLLSGQNGLPGTIIVFSRDELKQANMRAEFNSPLLQFSIGDVRDYHAICRTLQGADIVFHAAAMKRVETCEKFPDEAVATNYLGASNIVRAIRELHLPINTLVGVSSDKGCHPLNVYGSTKFLQEARFLRANDECETRFVSVRYGNVMGSRGSVIPIWQEQARKGTLLTVTDPDMTRFLISLDQAVDTLLAALEYAQRGEVYVPHSLPAARVGDMAEVFKNGRVMPIHICGKGLGEKMHEVLVTEEEGWRTIKRGDYYVVTQGIQGRPALDSEYCSRDNIVSLEALRALFEKYVFTKQEIAVK